ncbi:MAG: hypothetical protein V1774_05095 [Candidatus Eisenbacteria bacterium]
MRLRYGCLAAGIMVFMLTLPSEAWRVQAEDASPPAEAAPASIPKWMIYVRAYGYDVENSPALAIHRRLGPRSDIGLQLSAALNSYHEGNKRDVYADDDERTRGVKDIDRFDLGFHTEYRRWKLLSEKLSSWMGLRFSVGYGRADRDEDTDHQEESDPQVRVDVYDTEYLDAGLALTLGAELELIPHLAAAMALVPLRYMHHWTKTVTDTDIDEDGDGSFARDENWSRSYDIDTSLTAVAYLVLRL